MIDATREPVASERGCTFRLLPGIIVTASLLSGLLSSLTASAQAAPPSTQATPAQTAPQPTSQSPPVMSQEDWQATMSRNPVSSMGCFEASYPSTEWRKVPCTTAKPPPPLHRRGPRTPLVGNGTDWEACTDSNPLCPGTGTSTISSAIGSFDSVTGVTNENDSGIADRFSLQVNTNKFNTTAFSCNNITGCQGWQQFTYQQNDSTSATSGVLAIWHALLGFGTCPDSTWSQVGSDCYRISDMRTAVPGQMITKLGQLNLTGQVVSGGMDTVILSTGTNMYMATDQDSFLNVAPNWQVAEFNVFGLGGGSQANFTDPGSSIVVRTSLNDGAKMAPTCTPAGTTGETNNLTLVGLPAMVMMGTLPSIVFTESNVPGDTPTCAHTAGDTHIITFDGLLYDFQASGDFLLVQAHRNDLDRDDFDRDDFRTSGDSLPDRDFVVQTRQVSGAPTWPNASVNKAVATRMGKTRVAVCLAPTRLVINGNPDQLYDGESLPLSGGVTVSLSGNVYDIRRQDGDIVRAEVNNGWINVSVGYAPESTVRGLLGNANGNTADDIATLYGKVLTQPVSFADLYQTYGDTWRVLSSKSLLSVCGDRIIERGNPTKPFYANDLTPDQYTRARAICTAAGVEDEALLDACTLDVTVLADETAATFFALAPTPIAVMQSGSSPPPSIK